MKLIQISMDSHRKSLTFFLYYGDVTEGIFESQVHYHIEMITQKGIVCILLALVPVKFIIWRLMPTIRTLKKVRRHGIRILILPTFNPMRPQGKLLHFIYAYLFSLFIRICNSISLAIIIHARGMFCAHLAQKIKSFGVAFRFIFDMRADEVSELVFRLESLKKNANVVHRLSKTALEMQIDAIRHANVLLMVSQKLRSHVEKYLSLHNSRTFIIPSLARSDIFRYDSSRRDYMRSRLGLKDKLVLGYSGSVSPWQKVDRVMDILNGIRSRGLDAVLLLLTRETLLARGLAEEKGCEAFTWVMDCDYSQLGDYIMSFDMGFLLRERLQLNHVASPTKFAEYMLCGVPAFISSGIGDIDDIVRSHNVGVLVQNIADEDEIAHATDQFLKTGFDRKAISEFGLALYARESYLSLYEKIYGSSW